MSQFPSEYSLEQNYPNPFNPATVIRYSLVVNGYASLKIYDVLGREVATLVNEMKESGEYTVQWNGEGFPSGIYFYRLDAGEFTETKNLLLMK